MSLSAADRDESVDPGVDFYRYANGGWIDVHPIPAGYGAWGSFENRPGAERVGRRADPAPGRDGPGQRPRPDARRLLRVGPGHRRGRGRGARADPPAARRGRRGRRDPPTSSGCCPGCTARRSAPSSGARSPSTTTTRAGTCCGWPRPASVCPSARPTSRTPSRGDAARRRTSTTSPRSSATSGLVDTDALGRPCWSSRPARRAPPAAEEAPGPRPHAQPARPRRAGGARPGTGPAGLPARRRGRRGAPRSTCRTRRYSPDWPTSSVRPTPRCCGPTDLPRRAGPRRLAAGGDRRRGVRVLRAPPRRSAGAARAAPSASSTRSPPTWGRRSRSGTSRRRSPRRPSSAPS